MGDEPKPKLDGDLATYSQASRHLAASMLEEKGWSGLPIPVVGLKLILEPRYKHKAIAEFRWKEFYDDDGTRHEIPEEQSPEPSEFTWINSWWNSRYQLTVIVLRDKAGRARFNISTEDRLSMTIRTIEAAAVWPVEAEQKAQRKLESLIPAESYELYMLTGHFPELSKRSQVTYLFRKGRPTIALRQNEEGASVLCALCLHPIGYYDKTWAGVMCPTDEVIAHLLMMRGSEEKFWANANQHSVEHPAAGI